MGLNGRFEDVLAAAQHGSEWAWQEILEELGPAVLAYARSQGATDSEDLLGEVLEGVVRGIDGFGGGPERFRSWVFTIAHSRVIDDRRRRGRRPPVRDGDVPDVAGAPDAFAQSDSLARQEALGVLDQLPESQRAVVALRVVAGLSVNEVALVLDKRPGAVRTMMHRALRSLEKHVAVDV